MKNGSKSIILLFTFTLLVSSSAQLKNLKIAYKYLDKISEPVIGILTIPTSDAIKSYLGKEHEAYVPSSYKKWIEQTGARPVAIPHFMSMKKIKSIMRQINGIFLPGGAPELLE